MNKIIHINEKTYFSLLILTVFILIGFGIACDDNYDNEKNKSSNIANQTEVINKESNSPLKNITVINQPTEYSIDVINGKTIPDENTPIVISGPEITVGGWAIDRQAQNAAGGVYINIDGTEDVPTKYGESRKDVATAHNNQNYQNSGFAASIMTASLSKGQHTLGLRILSADGKGYYESEKKIKIDIK